MCFIVSCLKKKKKKQKNEQITLMPSFPFTPPLEQMVSFPHECRNKDDGTYMSLTITYRGESNGTPLQYSCLDNPMDPGAWWAAVHGLTKSRHDWVTWLSLFTFMHWRRKWQPTPVFSPGESEVRRSLLGCHLWGRTESDTTEAT